MRRRSSLRRPRGRHRPRRQTCRSDRPSIRHSPIQQIATATQAATVQPTASGFVQGAQIYPFAENAIFEGYVAPGLVTDLVLQPGEELVAVASGDTARWVIGDTTSGSGETKQTHVLVKPFAPGLATMLEVGSELSIVGGSNLVQAIRESAQSNTARAGDQITQRNLDIQPTITIRPDAPVRVLVTRDLILAPWPKWEN